MLINEEKNLSLRRWGKSFRQAWLLASLLTLPLLLTMGSILYPETHKGVRLFRANAGLLWETTAPSEFFQLVLELAAAPVAWYLGLSLLIALPLTNRFWKRETERPERRSLEDPDDRRLSIDDYLTRVRSGYSPGLRFTTRSEQRAPSYLLIALVPLAILFVSVVFLL